MDSLVFQNDDMKRQAFQCEIDEMFLPSESTSQYSVPVVHVEAFGALAPSVKQNVEAVERFLALPATPFRFTDHHAWSDWKVRMRKVYGEAFANEQMKKLEENKLRVNRLSGLTLAGEGLIMAFEHGNEEDKVFAASLDEQWKPGDVLSAIERYRQLPVSEGVKMMAYFDQKALDLLVMLRDEGRRRSGGAWYDESEKEETIAAK